MVPCSRLILLGERSRCSTALLPTSWNWSLNSFARQDSSGAAKKNRWLAFGVVGDPNQTSMNLHEVVKVFACMLSADGHKWDGVLGHINVALFQFSPCFWVVNPECMHVCYVARVACGQSRLYVILFIAKDSLLSASPASR